MELSTLFLASLTLSCLPLSLSYRDGARSESCYNMLAMHINGFTGRVAPSMECGDPCPFELRLIERVNAQSGLTPMETTYRFEKNYHLQLISTSTATFEGFMVEARNSTEDFEIGSTIWGTWVTDLNLLGSGYDPGMNLLYHTVECNRSLTSSDGPFDNAATQKGPDDLSSINLFWKAPLCFSSSEEYLQLPEQIQFWFVTVQQRLTYFSPIAGPTLNRPVVVCDNLTNPDNGTVDTSQGTTLDQVATYSCNNGYVLVGNMTRTCQVGNCQVGTYQVDGIWSGTEPFCLVDCGALTNPDNGTVDTSPGTTLGQVATYSCNNGYVLVGNMTRTCQVDGMWSGTEPFCVVDCGALTNQGNGRVDTSPGTTLDQVATYSCNNGYVLVGNMTRTCQVDGMWSGTEPFCVVDCGALTNQGNGRVDTSPRTTLDQVATYSCNNGYVLVGNMTRTCQLDGMWSGTEPFCVVDCGALTNPDNGTVDTSQGTTLDQVANYSCNNGYVLVGNMTRTCQLDGMWSGTEPFCELMCLNGGTFSSSTGMCDCPTGFTGSDCSATEQPTVTATPTSTIRNNALMVTLPQYTAENFTEDVQETMRNTTAMVMNRYCAENNEACQTVAVARTRRQVVQIQPSDVIITNIRNNARGELEFMMYIQVAGGAQVLAVEALESAVQSGINDYMAAGFGSIEFVRVVPTSTTSTTATTITGLLPGVIAAIAAGSVFGVVLVLLLLLLCILLCIRKHWRNYRDVQLTYASVLEKPENLYVVQNELVTLDSPTEGDTQTDGTEKDETQKDDTQKDDEQKDGTQAENNIEDAAL